jgi:predicted transcriptional regulator
MVVAREYVKALIDRLSDEQVQAIKVILESMALPEIEISPAEESEIKEGLTDLEAGRKVSAADVWKEDAGGKSAHILPLLI